MRQVGSGNGHGGGVNVTPMIDVIMVLIVFYLLVGKLAGDRRVAMALPVSTASAQAEPDDALIVNVVLSSGAVSYVVGGSALDAEQVAALAERSGAVEVRAPREASWASVGALLSACEGAGVEVRLATEASR